MKILLCLIFCLFSFPVWAEQPSEKQKVIIEMLDVTHISSLMDQTSAAVIKAILKESKTKNTPISKEFIQLVTNTLKKEMAPLKREVISFMVSFMTDKFTLEELKVMLDYNKTSAGQKALALMPQMMAGLQIKIQKSLPEIVQNFQKTLQNELKNKQKSKS